MKTRTRDLLQGAFLRDRSSDASQVQQIQQGRAALPGGIGDPTSPDLWARVGEWNRTAQLQTHAFRWLDPVRRAQAATEGAGTLWLDVLRAWAVGLDSEDQVPTAWARLATVQRARVLALGALELGVDPSAVPTLLRHRDEVRAILGDAAEHVHHLDCVKTLFAFARLLEADPAVYADELERAVHAAFDETGFAVADSFRGLETVREEWRAWLEAVGEEGIRVGRSQERLEVLEVHLSALQPSGRQIGFGSSPATTPAVLDDDRRLEYIRHAGAQGHAPAEVRSISRHGLVTGRSGWGETEKDLRDEVFYSALFGRASRTREHQDLGRLTFYADGIEWIIDPADLPDSTYHSAMTVDGRAYRTYGTADIIHQRHDDVVDEFTLSCKTFLPVQWQRQAVFVRTGNYLVVSDVLRASNDFSATQQWIINPAAEIDVDGQRVMLSIGERACCLTTGAPAGTALELDEVTDAETGARIAWRLWFRTSGASMRLVTVVSPVVDKDEHRVVRLPVPGNEFALRVQDKMLDEVLVVTREQSALVSSDVETQLAVDDVLQRAAIGAISPEEALSQRLATRRAIEEVKSRLWASERTQTDREVALDELVGFARDQGMTAMRDHALAAAMVDVASIDLAARLEAIPIVANHRRSPLINWTGEEFVHPYYKVPVHTARTAAEPVRSAANQWIHSVDLGQIVPSAYVADAEGDVLTVYFHGATDRGRLATPRYERLRSFSTLGLGPMLFFSDPGLDLDARMILSWFIGTDEVDQHRAIADMIRGHAARTGCEKVLLVGNSGGAFAALQLSAYLPGSKVVAFNPQIQVKHYVPRIADTAMWNLFGEVDRYAARSDSHRIDLIEKFKMIDFDRDVVLIQNTGDDHHYNDHFVPFRDAFAKSLHPERLECQTPNLGPGHRVPPPDQYIETVRIAATAFLDRGWSPVGRWSPHDDGA